MVQSIVIVKSLKIEINNADKEQEIHIY